MWNRLESPAEGTRPARTMILVLLPCVFFGFGTLAGYAPLAGVGAAGALAGLWMIFHRPCRLAHLFLLLTPFAALFQLPFTEGGFSLAVAVALGGWVAASGLALARRDPALWGSYLGRWDQILPLLFLLVMLISVQNSPQIAFSAKQVQQFVYVVAAYYLLQVVLGDRPALQRGLHLFLGAGVVVGFLGLVESVQQVPVYTHLGNRSVFGASVSEVFLNAKRGRINGLIGDPPFHGIFMCVIAILCADVALSRTAGWKRWAAGAGFLLAVFNIMGTGSRGALGALILGLVAYVALAEIPNKALLCSGALAVLAIVASVTLLAMPELDASRSFTYRKESTETAQLRWNNIPVALELFREHPLIGGGPDSFLLTFHRFGRQHTPHATRPRIQRTHNTPLQILAEYGLLGFCVFAALIGSAARRALQVRRRSELAGERRMAVALFASLVSFLVFMLASNSLLDQSLWIVLALSQVTFTVATRGEQTPEAAHG